MTDLPHNLMAEQGLLGSLLRVPEDLELIDGRITGEDFYVPVHAKIFEVLASQQRKGLKPWPGSVLTEVVSPEWDMAYLNSLCTSLFQFVEHGATTLTCAYAVKEASHSRKLIGYAKLLTEAAAKGDNKACAALQEQIATLTAGHINVLPDDPVKQAQDAFARAKDPEPMMSSGIGAWDKTFGGIAPNVRYVVAGRAGAGKTALALNIAWNVAKQGKKVRYIFFEGSVDEIWWRIYAREMHVPITSFRKGLTENQQLDVLRKKDRVMGYDFVVVRDPKDVGDMIARCGKCDLIVLDGISSAPAPQAENLIERVSEVTRYCKTLADKTGAAVIMLAHLNSEGVKNAGSGTGIYGGQAATFDPESILELKVDEDTIKLPTKGIDGIVTKNRYGALETMKLQFTGEYMTYGDRTY
jgi:replicative DNA helicase